MWNAFSTLSLALPTPQGSFAWTLPIVPIEIVLWATLCVTLGMALSRLRRLARTESVEIAAWAPAQRASHAASQPRTISGMTPSAAFTP